MDKTTAGACVLAVSLAASAVEAQAPMRDSAAPLRAWMLVSDTVLAGPGSDIGATVRDLSAAEARGRWLERGVMVQRVSPGSPAARAGLAPGDIVIELDRVSVTDARQYRREMHNSAPGRPVWVWFVRDGTTRSTVMTPEAVRGS